MLHLADISPQYSLLYQSFILRPQQIRLRHSPMAPFPTTETPQTLRLQKLNLNSRSQQEVKYDLNLRLPKATSHFTEILLSFYKTHEKWILDLLRLPRHLTRTVVVKEQICWTWVLLPAIFFISNVASDCAKQKSGHSVCPSAEQSSGA